MENIDEIIKKSKKIYIKDFKYYFFHTLSLVNYYYRA